MTARRVLIDCDPGQDDFINLMLAFASPEDLTVAAVTAVAGNVPLALTERNARLACDWAGVSDVPVHAGCDRPLLRDLVTAEYVHGETGIDGLAADVPQVSLAETHAVPAIADTVRAGSGPTTLIATGPLTNVALALRIAPDIAERIDEIVLMGGARAAGGNVTPSAEFNMAVDPHAAAIVAASGIPLAVFGLDVTHQLRMTRDRRAHIRAMNTPLTRVIADMLDFSAGHDAKGPPLHDPCTGLYLLAPALFSMAPCALAIETDSPLTYGHTAVDFKRTTDRAANARWATTIDHDAAFALLCERIGRL